MFFALITFLAAFLIEGIGTVVSVIGLSTLFGANPIIIVLAVALDVGKLVVVTLLYKHWRRLGYTMRAYGLIAAMVTMTITSAGAGGYLSGEFQKAVMGVQEGSLKVDVLKGQIAKYEERKKQIDDQIAAIPEKYSATQRIRLMNQFKQEQQDLQLKIGAIDKQLPDLQIKQIGVEAKAGPILYIAKAFNITIEEAVKWVILMIIIVFDPLAVFLIIAGNFLWEQFQTRRKDDLLEAELKKFKPEVHGGEFRPDDFEEQSLQHRIEVAQEVFTPPPKEPNVQEPVPVLDVAPSPVVDPADRDPRPDPEPVEVKNYPDTTLTKVYTRDDLIAAGVSDEQLIEAGYEPREAAIEAAIEAAMPEQEVNPVPVSEPAPQPVELPAPEPEVHPALLARVNANGVLVPPAPPPAKEPTLDAPLTFRTPAEPEPLVQLETVRLDPVAQAIEARDIASAKAAGMSLEDWRAAQLKKLDRIQEGVNAIAKQLKPREQITLSSLGLVKPDPDTIVDAAANQSGLTR
jgi:hypothetical protein